MLTELSIRNLGLIGSAAIELSPGLTVISGETGAGKSMLLSAIHLLTGGRASASSVGKASDQLSVDSSWELSEEDRFPELTDALDSLGAEVEDGIFHLSRTVKSDGKSRAILGGRPGTVKSLTAISSQLLSIHGQADQLKLRDSAEQLRILDSFGLRGEGSALKLEAYRDAYRAWKRAAQQLKEVQSNAAAKRREIAALKSFIEDYEEIDPQLGELESLEAIISKLENHEQIRDRLNTAQAGIDHEDYGPLSVLEGAADELRRAKALDPELEPLHALAEVACESIEELAKALELQLSRSDDDALEELAEAQGRIVEIQGLLKRSGVESILELDEEITSSRKALEALSVYDRPLDDLRAELEAALIALKTAGAALTALRAKAAQRLAERVNGELGDLAMGSTVFAVSISEAEPSSSGLDEVSFTIQQRGQDAQPMAKAASGGELSRLMLALELSVADEGSAKTYIFDEVDAGIGGATALEVGKRLAMLARSHQVIVVSHLAQVAAYADSNLKVAKHDDGKAVSTTVDPISEADRPKEIARMLSGVEQSEHAQEHARELLATAAALRTGR